MTIHLKNGIVFHILYLVFIASIIFSLRAVSSITIGIILLASVLLNPKTLSPIFWRERKQRVLFFWSEGLF